MLKDNYLWRKIDLRILNDLQITNHGNIKGRRLVVELMETALQAADPYRNACKLLKRQNKNLYIGNKLFEADNDPQSGTNEYKLDEINNIFVVGAGKGVQRVAKALEDVLDDHLSGGCLIAKHGDPVILSKIKVVHGAHPIPDENCIKGCSEIMKIAETVTEKDLVFTIFGNGGSSLLTMPEDGISLEDVKWLTNIMQIEKGASTIDLNVIRNHIDKMKGGKLSRLFSKAQCVHIIITDSNHHVIQQERHDYYGLMGKNVWLHNLPDNSTFSMAIEIIKKYEVENVIPLSIRKFLQTADPKYETVKFQEFKNYRFRVFGIMPDSEHFFTAVYKKAKEKNIPCHILTQTLHAEASCCAKVICSIVKNIASYGQPLKKPVILLSSGEMLVTVEDSKGVGGRNQEFALQAALEIDGFHNIVVASADSDGTDGPGGLKIEGAPVCLGGAIVDGFTLAEAKVKKIDIEEKIKNHDTSETLWYLNCGIHIEQNISLNDITIIYVSDE
jgi:glycerate-2-kinase